MPQCALNGLNVRPGRWGLGVWARATGEGCGYFKGKLAQYFMVSYLVLISCLSDMVRIYVTEENAKINIFCSYREKKIKLGNSESLGFPISPCAMLLEGEFPRNRKEFLCVMIQHMLNQII